MKLESLQEESCKWAEGSEARGLERKGGTDRGCCPLELLGQLTDS